MAQYVCRYLTEKQNVVERTLQAASREEAIESLRDKGYRIIKVEEAGGGLANLTLGRKHVTKKTLTLFCRQMATMLTSGIPMVTCFDVVASQSEDKVFKKLMTELTGDVKSGCSLSTAMEKHPDDFPEMLTEMVKIGEVTGDLSGVLTRMAEQYERDAKITQKIRGALTYPIVVLCVAVAACIFMLIKVVPSFVDVFKSLDTELPKLTQLLLNVSNFLVHRWYVILLVAPIAVILLIRFFRLRRVRYAVDRAKISVKGLRGPMRKLTSARFARTLYTLISSGVPIIQALEYSKRNVLNLYVEDNVDRIITGIRQGKSLAAQMGETTVFPKLLVSMISVGESSGNLEGMLSKSADYFDDETTAAVEQLMTVIEPVMIVLVGLLIGVIVLALYSPMFGAITAMQSAV